MNENNLKISSSLVPISSVRLAIYWFPSPFCLFPISVRTLVQTLSQTDSKGAKQMTLTLRKGQSPASVVVSLYGGFDEIFFYQYGGSSPPMAACRFTQSSWVIDIVNLSMHNTFFVVVFYMKWRRCLWRSSGSGNEYISKKSKRGVP